MTSPRPFWLRIPFYLAGFVGAFGSAFGQESLPADELLSARAAAAAGRARAAIAAYDRAAVDRRTDAALYREAAEVAASARRFADAARFLHRLTELRPDDPRAWFDLGVCRFNQNRYDLALPALRRVTELEANDESLKKRADVRRLAGEAARELGLWGDALGELRLAAEREPEDGDTQRLLGSVLFDSGDPRGAVAPLHLATRLLPDDPDGWAALSVALEGTGDLAGALQAAKRVRALKPNDAAAAYRLGALLLAQKDLAAAEAYLNAARDLARGSAETLFALAQVSRLRNRAGDADRLRAEAEVAQRAVDLASERGRVFRRKLATDAEDPKAHLDYALDLLSQGRFDDAERILGRLLSFAPETDVAIVNLATLFAQRGRLDPAELELAKILERAPDHVPALLTLARVKLVRRDAEAAAVLARRAAAADAGSVDAHRMLAQAARALGLTEEAETHEAKAAALDRGAPPR